MKYLNYVGEFFLELFRFFIFCIKAVFVIILIIFFLFLLLHLFTDGETVFTNREKIVTRLEKEAFPLIEKYHLSGIGDKSVCYPTDPPHKSEIASDHCIKISETSLEEQKVFKKIQKITLKNGFLEHDFREARIQFDKDNKIKYGEFYFSHSYNELYIYSTPPQFKDIKTAQSYGYINPYWISDKY